MAKTGTIVRPRQKRTPALQAIGGSVESLYSILFPGMTLPGMQLPVTEHTVNGLTGVSAAVGKIANACSMMMVGAEVFAADGRTTIDPPTVVVDPCTGYESFTYWREVFSSGLMRGNWIGIKCDYDPDGFPQQVLPVPRDSVNAYYDEDGYLVYEIAGATLMPDEIVHVKVGLTLPGEPFAIGVIEAHRRNLSGMLDMQGTTNNVWREGAVPSGVVQLAVDDPTKEQVTQVKSAWVGALEGRRTVAVIGQKMSYTPVTWSAQDAQWLESRTFSIAEAALMFGLRPEDLGSSFGASGALTYGNRSDDALQRITDSYLPVMMPVEQPWSRLVPGRAYVRGNVEALLRSTTRERYELHQLAQGAGIETVDESRAIEGKPKLDPPPEPPAPPPEMVPPVPMPELPPGAMT
ncbi:MAG: phage portal protein [Ilumatobacteraceae bacterium]